MCELYGIRFGWLGDRSKIVFGYVVYIGSGGGDGRVNGVLDFDSVD